MTLREPAPSRAAAWRAAAADFVQALRPAPVKVDARERWRAVAGAALGLALTALLCRAVADPASALPWLVAPLGATAVLVFAAPAGPMSQPWAAFGGNTVSAFAGIACVHGIADPALAGAAAVAVAIALMFALRCLHPPGGAIALTAVLLHARAPSFALFPVATNTALLVLAGIVYNGALGRRYPHAQVAPPKPAGEIGTHFSSADFDAALARYNQVLDISRDDLEDLLRQTEAIAYRRLFGELRCADIMSRSPVAVQFGTPLAEAWALMRGHRVKALPVTDRAGRVAGIVTRADFLREARVDAHDGLGERVKALVRSTGEMVSNKPDVVGRIMTRRVRVVREDRPVVDLIGAFSGEGHHHLPVIDREGRLAGILTQSDFVRALARAIGTTPAA